MKKSTISQVQAYFPEDMLEKIDYYANGFGMSRSKFIVHVVQYALANDKYLQTACKLHQVQRALEAQRSVDQQGLDMFVEKAEDLFTHVESLLKDQGTDTESLKREVKGRGGKSKH